MNYAQLNFRFMSTVVVRVTFLRPVGKTTLGILHFITTGAEKVPNCGLKVTGGTLPGLMAQVVIQHRPGGHVGLFSWPKEKVPCECPV